MKRLSSLLRYDREFEASVSRLKEQLSAKKARPIIINGLSGGAVIPYLAESILSLDGYEAAPALILVSSDAERESVASSLSKFGVHALSYKPRDFVFHNISASHDTERERLSVLSQILNSDVQAVVSTVSAALTYTMPKELLASLSLKLAVGCEIEMQKVILRLSELGFACVDAVESAGQFARRGGILDVWPRADLDPVRIEFFGDEIDRIVHFDSTTQRATHNLTTLELIPAGEVIIDQEARGRVEKTINKLLKDARSDEVRTRLSAELAVMQGGAVPDFRDKYFGVIYKEYENLFSYLSLFGRIPTFIVDTNGCREELEGALDSLDSQRDAMLEMGTVTPQAARYMASLSDYTDLLSENAQVHVNSFSSGLGNIEASGLFGFRCRRCISYGGNFSMLLEDLRGLIKSGYRTIIFSENMQGAKSLMSSLESEGIHPIPIYKNADFDFSLAAPGAVLIDVGSFSGFELITPKIAVLSMARDEGRAIMANKRRQRILRKVGGAGQRLMSYADLSVGDYVVHANYGIGLFEGIETVTVDFITKDYIKIKYAGTDKLFVPCDRLEFIGKYIGEKDKDGKVKLSKMGGNEWTRVKAKAKNAARDIAKNLIALYAERQRKPGFAFPADSELEDEFAASFDYQETDSQLVAISEIKADMMRPVPMNRLLCGDVGFGKTEVALRAAFKAIMGGKQVAILVPTTILALQHFETALSRMRNYPVTVEMISRFRTPKEQENILRKTARGEVDILIGTHKLLSKKVQFRDLGLLIIDEEQRFGVSQKEKLKEMAKNVDVLTLTATPIPRTLNMAMNGISDMSILDEAPGDRRPVQTYVLEYDDGVIFDAIKREIMRGGQVLYLYNKIEDIDFVASKIMHALPNARVACAHGQMDRDELEDIWQMLVRSEIDVLVCTTIIETGVDLPGANTLIIEDADRMGLSQLHQIRGRVGRSSRQAYAYFTYRAGKALSEIAAKRLVAIREFAEFGAGFKVALRDLEIRGAGNLLGAEQHGYIDSVGYDLYVKLLSEAVLEERGQTSAAVLDSTIDIKISAHIPERYISVSSHRMEMYKKISLITIPADADDITDEFADRFGELPVEVSNLIKVSLLRALSAKVNIKKIEFKDGYLTFTAEKPELDVWSEVFSIHQGLSFKRGEGCQVIARILRPADALDFSLKVIKSIYECKNEENING